MASKLLHGSTVERELQRFNSVVEKHTHELDIIKETFDILGQPSWHPYRDVISLKLNPFEFVSDFHLINTDNQLVNKTTIALTSLCREMATLAEEAENDFYFPLAVYGRACNKDLEKDTPQLMFSKILPLLLKINSYTQHVSKVVQNVSQQMNVLHSNMKKRSDIHAGNAHYQVVFEHIGRVLGSLIILDELIAENTLLQEHCALYERLVKSSLSNSSTFSASRDELKNLKSLITDIENQVINASILRNVLNEVSKKSSPPLSANGTLRDEILTVVMGWSSQIEDTNSDNWLCEHKDQVLAVTALSTFYFVVFDTQEKKVAKMLIALFKKVPCIMVAVNHVWMGEEYLKSQFSSIYSQFERKALDGLFAYRKQYLSTKTQNLYNEVQNAKLKILSWSTQIEMAAKKSASRLTKQDLSHRASLLWKGLLLGSHLKQTAESIVGLHTTMGKPMGKTCAIALCRLLELLKSVEYTYHHNTFMMAETFPHLRQYLGFQILTLLKNTKERAKRERKLSQHILDVLSALSLSEQILSGNGNAHRLLIARVALSLANQDKIIADEDLANLLSLLRRLNIASDIQGRIRKVANADFLFDNRIIFRIYLQDYWDNLNHTNVHRIHYMVSAINDSDRLLRMPKELLNRESLVDSLHTEINSLIKHELLDKVCEKVETELRLKSHSRLHVEQKNPFEVPHKALGPLINLQPIQLFGRSTSVKDYVEEYLQKTFYNLTVISPHNGASYEKMRNLAISQFNLGTVNSHLPSQTLEQGVDVLEIMRNINVFVQRYHYNLNQQFFVEIESNNKHLNTVSIKHIANSIRTHGTGIINTTVNFTYQFLRKKFHILSQFLYDEHIKSRLLKDMQFWKEVKETENSFPYSRAYKFHKGIRTLGVSSQGLSYLDQFRKLVTHIGNAIGYVRLVRSGCLHCISCATQFIPDLQNLVTFRDLCNDDFVEEKTLQAASNLDALISNLTGHFQKEADYFKIMVDVFSSVLRDSKNAHLKNFFLLLPPMTVNYVEYYVGAKENIQKKYRPGATFTDDGFAIGVTYILNVLGQKEAFDSLHWWSGVRRNFIKEKQKVETDLSKAKAGDIKLHQTLSLTLSRLEEFQRTFEYLFLSISSAQVFFRDAEDEVNKEKSDKEQN